MSQEEWTGGVGALQDGRFSFCVHSDRICHEAAALVTGCGVGLHEGSPLHRQAKRGLHEAAPDLQRHPQRKVSLGLMLHEDLYSNIAIVVMSSVTLLT